MPKTSIIPEGSGKPLAPYVPGSMADGVVYVSGTLPFMSAMQKPRPVTFWRLSRAWLRKLAEPWPTLLST